MALLILSFVAGVLTVAAPCILPLLPVIVGGSVVRGQGQNSKWYQPVIIAASLAGSVIVFSLLLKSTTALLGVPQMAWQIMSGGIVLLFGLSLISPGLWEKLMVATGLNIRANRLLGRASNQKGYASDVVLGAALGPVFSSCSPTYALIVAAVLPASFGLGLIYLGAYALGLAGALLCIAYLGQAVIDKLGLVVNPEGKFHKALGLLFIVVGFMVGFGFDKKIQAYVLERGWYDPIMRIEQRLEAR